MIDTIDLSHHHIIITIILNQYIHRKHHLIITINPSRSSISQLQSLTIIDQRLRADLNINPIIIGDKKLSESIRTMVTLINPNDWQHFAVCSVYNRNIFYNEKTNQYIVETFDGCEDYFSYYWCNKYGTSTGYIGIPTTDDWKSIFDRVDIVELDDTIS